MGKNQTNKPELSGAMANRARHLEEQRLRQEKAKKKRNKIIIIVSCILIVVIACSVAIPLTIQNRANKYTYLPLKNLCNSSGDSLTAAVRELNGKPIQIKGYLLECTSYTRFLAGSSNAACPFSTQKYVKDVIPAVYKDGSIFSSSIDTKVPYIVYGTLHIGDTVIAQYQNSYGGYDDEIAGMVVYVERFEKA